MLHSASLVLRSKVAMPSQLSCLANTTLKETSTEWGFIICYTCQDYSGQATIDHTTFLSYVFLKSGCRTCPSSKDHQTETQNTQSNKQDRTTNNNIHKINKIGLTLLGMDQQEVNLSPVKSPFFYSGRNLRLNYWLIQLIQWKSPPRFIVSKGMGKERSKTQNKV